MRYDSVKTILGAFQLGGKRCAGVDAEWGKPAPYRDEEEGLRHG